MEYVDNNSKLLCTRQKFGNSPIGPHCYHYLEKRQKLWEHVLNIKCMFRPSTQLLLEMLFHSCKC